MRRCGIQAALKDGFTYPVLIYVVGNHINNGIAWNAGICEWVQKDQLRDLNGTLAETAWHGDRMLIREQDKLA